MQINTYTHYIYSACVKPQEIIIGKTRKRLHKSIQLDMPPSNKQYCSCKTKRKSMQGKKTKVARQNSFCYVTNSFLSCSKIKKHQRQMKITCKTK